MNLQTEYTKRHGLGQCVMAGHEGLLFLFDPYSVRTIAVHTALRPKTHTLCGLCVRGDMCLETIVFAPPAGCSFSHHTHVAADQNIIPVVNKLFDSNFVPIPLRSSEEMESLVWKNFLDSCLKHNGNWIESTEGFRSLPNIEVKQMVMCCTHFPAYYQSFAKTLQFLLAGRKYLLNA